MKKFLGVSFRIIFYWLIIVIFTDLILSFIKLKNHSLILGSIIILVTILVPYFLIKKNYFKNRNNEERLDFNQGQTSNIVLEEVKKVNIKRILKWVFISIFLIVLAYIIFVFSSYNYRFAQFIEVWFGGKENYEKYMEKLDVLDSSYLGNYKGCLSINDDKEKNFCLKLASEKNHNIDICDSMVPNISASHSNFSYKESCYINYYLIENDNSVCNNVKDKKSCLFLFSMDKAQRKICGPLYAKDQKPTPGDCYEYAIEQKTKKACDGLEAAGGINFKDRCYLNAGLFSDEELSVVPAEINQCVYTKVVKVGDSIDSNLSFNSAVEFLNGVTLLSEKDSLNRSNVDDYVRLCLVGDSCPGNFPYKGTVYNMNNFTSNFSWTVSTSPEKCD